VTAARVASPDESVTAPASPGAAPRPAPRSDARPLAEAEELAVQVGETVGRYLLVAELGRGGMGTVFAAHDRELDRQVAIKFVTVADAAMTERFLAEARVTARCTHPNIVGVHEIGRHRDAPYLVLEYLAGEPLTRLARGPRLPVARVLTIMTAVGRALACAHSHGIVHRDLTPGNVMVLADDEVKVLDFGIAAYAPIELVDDDLGRTTGRRVEHAGTLPYMAPEQLLGGRLDGRADLWSFGVVLYELLVGRRPFEGADDDALRAAILDPARPAPALARARPDLPAELFALVARCLEKSRSRRYRTANELVATLQRLASGRMASELPAWLASRPSAAESDRVALGLVRALADRTDREGVDLRRTRVWSDGRVELAVGAVGASPEEAVQVVAQLASQAIAAAGGPRDGRERRRARRMLGTLTAAAHPEPSRRPSARALAGRLAAAHDGPSRRTALVALLVVAVTSGFMLGWPRRGAARTTTPIAAPVAALQLERLDRSLERLRAAGDPASADALFARFVAQPENTAVASTAWLRRAARELASRDLEAALASAGAAYLAAPDERTATRALAAVVEVQLARQRWFEVAAALATIGRSDDPALARAATAVALATRRPLPDQPRSASDASVAALRLGQREPRAVTAAVTLDLDGDGRDEIVALDGQVVRAWRPGGETLWQGPWPRAGDALCAGRDPRGAWLAIAGLAGTSLFQVEARAATAVQETVDASACAFGDLDDDGAVELYLIRRDELVRLAPDAAGAWRATRRSLGSEATALATADLDDDGIDELALAVGEWRAYDVRVLAGPELTLVDRVRLGRVAKLAALARGPGRGAALLARKDGAWPSAVFLPADRPAGAADGYHLLELEGGRLRVTGHLADERLTNIGGLDAADLDGDGRDEALVTDLGRDHRRVTVVRVGDAGDLTAAVVDGVAVLAAGPVGASGRHAALAEVSGPSGIETWWLGLGATPVPPLPSPGGSTPAPPPPGLEPAMARTWRRAGDLARAGATASALAAYEQLAAVAPPAAQAQALIEVLGLRRRRGEPLAASYESLSGRAPPGSAAELAALRAAVTAAVDEGEFTDAVRLIDRALASPALGVAERTTLQATRVGIAPATVALFDGDALDESWRIADPVGVRRDPVTRALVLDGFGADALATVELVRSHGPIELVVEGTVTRAEWAAGLTFTLRPLEVAGPPLTVRLHATGGGNLYQLVVEPALARAGPRHDVVGRVPVRARVTWLPDTGQLVRSATVGGQTGHQTARTAAATAAATRWRLEVTSTNDSIAQQPTRMALSLARLTVAGLAPAPPAAPLVEPLVAARRALANGRLDEVPPLLVGTSGPEATLIEGVLALRQGDRRAAVAALARLTGDDAWRGLAHLVRVDDGAHAATAGEAAGPHRASVIARAWATAAQQHLQAELVQRELTQNLRGLDLDAGAEASHLRLLRGRAYAAIGEAAAAAADLDALAQPARLAELPETLRAIVHLERARLASRAGDLDAARAALHQAFAVSPWPEATADLILLDPLLAPLAAAPGLERVHTLGRRVAQPPGRAPSNLAALPPR
jgi:hypothetical protein